MDVHKIFEKMGDIKVYNRDGRNMYYDPCRNNLVPATPEEIVRQKTVRFCQDNLKVPIEYIRTEDHLHHYKGVNENGRMDVVITFYNNGIEYPLALVECKEEKVPLSYQTYRQAERYADIIYAEYFFITNGIVMHQYKYNHDTNGYDLLAEFADYDDMLKGVGKIAAREQQVVRRYSCEQLSDLNISKTYGMDFGFIGEDTPEELIPHIANMYDCFMDPTHLLRGVKNEIFTLTEDLGVRFMHYGDASGGGFGTGWYRAFTVKDYKENEMIINIGIMSTGKTVNDPKYGNTTGKSVLVVSKNDGVKDETVVQINLNRFLSVHNGILTLTHNGVVKRKGARKEELIAFIMEKAPYLTDNKEIFLGRFSGEKLMYADNRDFADLIKNIITYTLLRDEYKNKFRWKQTTKVKGT